LIRTAILACLLGACSLAKASDDGAIATIVEGRVVVIRGLERFDADNRSRLEGDDLVQTGADGFMKVEFDDGTAVEIGPTTLARIDHPAHVRGNCAALYLLSGWIKVVNNKPDGPRQDGICAAGLSVAAVTDAVVLQAEDGAASVYVEDGSARAIDRRAADAGPVELRRGAYLVMTPGHPLAALDHPVKPFYDAVPRLFRDGLPSRYAAFVRQAPPPPRGRAAFAYADVAPWIDAEPAVRRELAVRWREKAADPAFRSAVERDLARHPEWEPVLHAARKTTPDASASR
jgi:hypothetical protein